MKRIIIILLFFIETIAAAQVNRYVATAAGGGNNGNAGTIDAPWLTLSYAETQMQAGGVDTVFVRGGTYNEALLIYGWDATYANPRVFMAYPGESPIIDGTGLDASGALVRIYGVDFFHFIGFTVQNADMTDEGTQDASGITSDGMSVVISNCIVHDVWSGGIGVGGSSAGHYGDTTIIDNCTVYDVCQNNNRDEGRTAAYWGAGISARRAPDYVTISNCVVHDVWGEGISTYEATYTTIEDNIVYDAFSVHLYVSDATDCLVQRNFVYRTKAMGTGAMRGINFSDEKSIPPSARNTLINNIVYGCSRNFSTSKMDNFVIANNTFVDAYDFAGVYPYNYDHVSSVFRNNIIIQTNSIACIYFAEDVDVVFSNNLYNKAYDADAVGADDQISAAHIVGTANGDTYSDTAYYRLVSESPAINGGYDLSGTFTDDYEGTARGVTFDIGAIEYAAPNPPLDPILADVETYKPVWATATTATTGGNVIDDGGDPGGVTQKGVCWNTGGNPTTADSKTEEGAGTGVFASTMTGLTKGTTYYVRAYATNTVGTAYGSQMSFRVVYFFHGGKILTHGGKVLFID